jgi:hypothetical protein
MTEQNAQMFNRLEKAGEKKEVLKRVHTGDIFLDDFLNHSCYKKPRSFAQVARTMEKQFILSVEKTMKMLMYIRMVKRKTNIEGTLVDAKTHTEGLRHEGIMRMIWVHTINEQLFFDNLVLYLCLGSWKDIFELLRYDHEYNGKQRVLNWEKITDIIIAGLSNDHASDYVKKYLPRIMSNGQVKTTREQTNNIIGKFICNRMQIGFKDYRLLKASGEKHIWQQQIAIGQFDDISLFDMPVTIRRLMAKSKFIENQDLRYKFEEYTEAVAQRKKDNNLFIKNEPLLDMEETLNQEILNLVEVKGRSAL